MTGPSRSPRRLHVTVSGPVNPPAARGLASWLADAAPRSARGTVDIALVSDRAMRTLNRTYRHVDTATDVLSFPAEVPPADMKTQGLKPLRSITDPLRSITKHPRSITTPRRSISTPEPVLGDIAIALGVAGRQAVREGHSLRTELRVLALHGLLHLLGYDHERDQGGMRRIEERLRRRAGLPAGVIARAPGTDQS
jgi:probable rRNA maturation factor